MNHNGHVHLNGVCGDEQWEKFLHVHEAPYWVRIPLRYPIGECLPVLLIDSCTVLLQRRWRRQPRAGKSALALEDALGGAGAPDFYFPNRRVDEVMAIGRFCGLNVWTAIHI